MKRTFGRSALSAVAAETTSNNANAVDAMVVRLIMYCLDLFSLPHYVDLIGSQTVVFTTGQGVHPDGRFLSFPLKQNTPRASIDFIFLF